MAFHNDQICGCSYTSADANGYYQLYYLPQVQLESHTTINPLCFTTKLTQTFHNPTDKALQQVRYTCPLYDGVAVCNYIVSFAGKRLVGTVKEKHVARQTYDAAIERGETAGLLEALPAGVFGVTLGNVPAKTDITVKITYCGELKHDASIDGLRYMLPTAIAARYGDYPGEVLGSNAVASRGISITVDIDVGRSNIRKVQSPSHPIAVSMGALSSTPDAAGHPFQPAHASATLALGTTELGADFILQLVIDDISKPQAVLETHPTIPNQRAIMMTLVPKFTLDPVYPEIVFIADQSGSMQGSKNDALVKALKVFLKSLPPGVRFNICAFGSRHRFLWPKSQAYNDGNVSAAAAFVNSFDAGLGGTEILEPITGAFERRLGDMPLEVMLLTDGEIWGEQAVFSYVNEQLMERKIDARVFALGIGGDVSHTLVEGVSRAGNGFAQFVTNDEDTDQKVVRMLKGALYAHTKDYKLEIHYAEDPDSNIADDDGGFELVDKVDACLTISDHEQTAIPSKSTKPTKSLFDKNADLDAPLAQSHDGAHLPFIDTPKLLQAPHDIPPLFPFNRSTVYVLLDPESRQRTVSSVTLRASSSGGPLELNIPVYNLAKSDIASTHQLAARKAIEGLAEDRGWLQSMSMENGGQKVLLKDKYKSRFDEIIAREAVRLGVTFGVASKWTSFVAVDEAGATNDASEGSAPSYTPGPARRQMASRPSGAPRDRMAAPMSASMSSGMKKRCMGSIAPLALAYTKAVVEADTSSDEDMGFGLYDDAPAASASLPPPPSASSFGSQLPPVASAGFMDASGYVSPQLRQQGQQQSFRGAVPSGSYTPSSTSMGSTVASSSFAYSAAKTTASPVSKMHALIALQQASGAWTETSEVMRVLGITSKTDIPIFKTPTDDALKATAIAIAYLQNKAQDKKDVWEMIVEKAQVWMGKNAVKGGQTVEELVAEAAALL